MQKSLDKKPATVININQRYLKRIHDAEKLNYILFIVLIISIIVNIGAIYYAKY